jgi:hypothetical protein
MSGRYGSDDMFKFTNAAALAALVLSMLIPGVLKSLLFFAALALMALSYYRAFSKNLSARRAENARFLRQKNKLRDWGKLRRDMWAQRREYMFFKCPSCKAMLRVPKGKGKIRVVCKKCGSAFEKKT